MCSITCMLDPYMFHSLLIVETDSRVQVSPPPSPPPSEDGSEGSDGHLFVDVNLGAYLTKIDEYIEQSTTPPQTGTQPAEGNLPDEIPTVDVHARLGEWGRGKQLCLSSSVPATAEADTQVYHTGTWQLPCVKRHVHIESIHDYWHDIYLACVEDVRFQYILYRPVFCRRL